MIRQVICTVHMDIVTAEAVLNPASVVFAPDRHALEEWLAEDVRQLATNLGLGDFDDVGLGGIREFRIFARQCHGAWRIGVNGATHNGTRHYTLAHSS
jgi:hypothetical protein